MMRWPGQEQVSLLGYEPATPVTGSMWRMWQWYQAEAPGRENASTPA